MRMNRIFSQAYIYTTIILLATVLEASRVTALLLLVFLLWSVYYWVYAMRRYQVPPVLKALNVLLVMFTIYGIFFMISGTQLMVREAGANRIVNKTDFLLTIYQSLLPIFAYYVLVKQKKFTLKDLKRIVPVFILFGVYKFFDSAAIISETLDTEEFTNGAAYTIMALIPLLVLYNKNAIIQYALLAGAMFIIILGVKRGAILISALCVVYIIWNNLTAGVFSKKRLSSTRRIAIVIIVGVFLFFVWRYVESVWESNDYLRFRLEYSMENGAGAREDIYKDLFRHFFVHANLFEMLFGMGAYGTLLVTTNLAHNDWLEVLTDEGILGLFIFAYYIWEFYRSVRKYKNEDLKLTYTLCFIIFFATTFFSMSYSSTPLFLSCAIGACIGLNDTVTHKLSTTKHPRS